MVHPAKGRGNLYGASCQGGELVWCILPGEGKLVWCILPGEGNCMVHPPGELVWCIPPGKGEIYFLRSRQN